MRHLLLPLFLLSALAVAAHAQDDAVDFTERAKARAARTLALSPGDMERRIEPISPRRGIAFIEQAPEVRPAIRHDLVIGDRRTDVPVTAFLARDGGLLRLESVATIDDPRRMSVAVQEQGTRDSGRRIVEMRAIADRQTLAEAWDLIERQIPMKEIDEFEILSVLFDFGDEGPPRPALIFHIWGPENPLGMPEDLPELAKNRIRIIYDIERGEISADNLL